jgi:hypothetical protein
MKKDINWHFLSEDGSCFDFPDARLLVKTNITIRITMSKYIEKSDHSDRSLREKIIYWAYLNEPM